MRFPIVITVVAVVHCAFPAGATVELHTRLSDGTTERISGVTAWTVTERKLK